jgi:hypothetical protein
MPEESQNVVAYHVGDDRADPRGEGRAKLLPDPAGVGHVDLGRQRNDHCGQVLWIGHDGHPWVGRRRNRGPGSPGPRARRAGLRPTACAVRPDHAPAPNSHNVQPGHIVTAGNGEHRPRSHDRQTGKPPRAPLRRGERDTRPHRPMSWPASAESGNRSTRLCAAWIAERSCSRPTRTADIARQALSSANYRM